ncbi:MAG: Hpt domain-containing protein [Flavobacteriales bacterium]|jgi:HPt (histidine-containing phosphotransfer) domain-containing protein|nr:Hpt domain-containing protein [Flavobacteriales bacterium]
MSANHYNLDYLKQVFQGNDAMVQRILGLFESEVPRYFQEMESLLQQDRWEELHPLAHKAKSSIGMLGMEKLLEQVLLIEHHSRTKGSKEQVIKSLALSRNLLEDALGALGKDRCRQTPTSECTTRQRNTSGLGSSSARRSLYRA